MKALQNKQLVAALLVLVSSVHLSWAVGNAKLDQAIAGLQQRWDVVKYQTAKEQQEAAYKALAADAHKISEQYAGQAEPLAWEAIILSTYAGAKGGLGALDLVKQARDLLLQAEKINAGVLQGSIYTTLGSLYYQVPGWPIGFGNSGKAREYLDKAIQYNPDGLDANFFYGDFLMEEGDYKHALQYLLKAEKAAPRKGREIGDAGRKKELVALIKRAKDNL